MFRRADVTEDAIVGPEGSQGEILSILVTAGASATVVSVYDGQDAGGTLIYQAKTSANVPATNLFLPYKNGFFVDVDANIAACTIVYEGAKP